MNSIVNKYYQDILSDPKKVVSSLSQEDIKTALIETILAYIDKTIDLKILTNVSNSIKEYSTTPLPIDIKNTIDEINSMHIVDDVLVDILDDLTK